MSKKVTVIFGGPRKDSNTHILVREALRGLAEKGATGDVFFLNDLNLKDCQSCNACKANNTNRCAIKDDMGAIHEAMERSDAVLVASPVYFGNVTALTRIWIDRLYSYLGPGHEIAGKKPIGFIFTQNNPDGRLFMGGLETFMAMTKLAGLEPVGHLLVPNLSKGAKPMVTESPEQMNAAYQLGLSLL